MIIPAKISIPTSRKVNGISKGEGDFISQTSYLKKYEAKPKFPGG